MIFIVVQTPTDVNLKQKQTFTQTRCGPGGYSSSPDLLHYIHVHVHVHVIGLIHNVTLTSPCSVVFQRRFGSPIMKGVMDQHKVN